MCTYPEILYFAPGRMFPPRLQLLLQSRPVHTPPHPNQLSLETDLLLDLRPFSDCLVTRRIP